ncbi:MAG: alpha/beta hydrolase, partial [Microcella sp.]|nr:alpha/beta hydrolase [Microcella sp.]
MSELVRSATMLPAVRRDIELHTADGITLVGELATPESHDPVATLVCLHPLPTAGGFMDSHILRKAAARLPAMADIAVLRFNFRGVSSPRGTSDGVFGHGDDERFDLDAAMAFVAEQGLPSPWLLGWSFGTEVALKHGLEH